MGGLYRVDTYFLAKTIAEVPIFTALPLVYICLVYYSVGLYASLSHFFTAAFVLILISHVATSFGKKRPFRLKLVACVSDFRVSVF